MITRALVNDLLIILTDEPTGNPDTKTGEALMKIFKDIRGGRHHNPDHATTPEIAAYDDRIVAEGRDACGWEYE